MYYHLAFGFANLAPPIQQGQKQAPLELISPFVDNKAVHETECGGVVIK